MSLEVGTSVVNSECACFDTQVLLYASPLQQGKCRCENPSKCNCECGCEPCIIEYVLEPEEVVMTLVNNECACVETGECTCDPDFCTCVCGCGGCTTEYVAEESQCGCGGNCACAGEEEYNNNDDAWV